MKSEVQCSHWDGCWRAAGHHACAVAEIERLEKRMAELGLALGVHSGKRSFGVLSDDEKAMLVRALESIEPETEGE